jgi:hypothetical protein
MLTGCNDSSACKRFHVLTTAGAMRVVTLWYRAPEVLLGSRSTLRLWAVWASRAFWQEGARVGGSLSLLVTTCLLLIHAHVPLHACAYSHPRGHMSRGQDPRTTWDCCRLPGPASEDGRNECVLGNVCRMHLFAQWLPNATTMC